MHDQLSDEQLHQRIEHEFTNHAPIDPRIVECFEALREQAKALAHSIIDLVPDGRERSVALTNLRHALMWAVGGIACAQEEALARLSDSPVASIVNEALDLPDDVSPAVTLGQVLGGEVRKPPGLVDPPTGGPFADAADLEDVALQALAPPERPRYEAGPGADLSDRLGYRP